MVSKSEEVFEITDFTTASDWERFVADFEEIITQWSLTTNQCHQPLSADGQWTQSHQTIRFSKIAFSVVFHRREDNGVRKETDIVDRAEDQDLSFPVACNDMMRSGTDFWPKRHCLVRWFGLRAFIVVTPCVQSIDTEDRTRVLLSSLWMAITNTECPLPVFCQLAQRNRNLFAGVCGDHSVRTVFEVLHFQSVPNQFRYLSGLLTLFRDKVRTSAETAPIQVSIRLTHALNQWPPGWTPVSAEQESATRLTSAVTEEAVLELQLATTWPSLSEEVVLDSEVHSDLVANNAPNWSLRVVFRDSVKCALSDSLALLLALKTSSVKDQQILSQSKRKPEVDEPEVEFKQALNRLTNASPLSVNLPQFGTSVRKNLDAIVDQTIETIFGDQIEDAISGSVSEDIATKAAPFGCLSWRIAIGLANAYFRCQEVAVLAILWQHVIRRLRRAWEQTRPLVHVEAGPPDLSACLLHQKIQMLTNCIAQRVRRQTDDHNDSDDEFFDCTEDQTIEDSGSGEGRLAKTGLTLLRVNQCLYVPTTQEPPPMTEDMVADQLSVLSSLGTSADSQRVRARMQSQSLVSDMQAFKAANNGCVFEDFVRWHSPRDWIPDSDRSGVLSPRFEAPGNVWRELWDSAEPMAANRQKRLFDDTTEAEKVFHFFAALTTEELIDLVSPLVAKSAVDQLLDKATQLRVSDGQWSVVRQLVANNDMTRVTRELRRSELSLNRFQSLLHKLTIAADLEVDPKNVKTEEEVRKLVTLLMTEPEVEFSSCGLWAQLIRRMFAESQQFVWESALTVGERDGSESADTMPAPVAREFILRLRANRPHSWSREVPQRMYCLLSEEEFRIAGAFTQDLTF